jgi:hypothetical protein
MSARRNVPSTDRPADRGHVSSTRLFSVTDAVALLPKVQETTADIIGVRADLAELTGALASGVSSPYGGVAEAKALEARLHELLAWFTSEGIQVKGWAPVLVDFPAVLDGRDVLLCWLEGERDLGWYHPVELGFPGRRRLP